MMGAIFVGGVVAMLVGAAVMAAVALTDHDPAEHPPLAGPDAEALSWPAEIAAQPDPDWARETNEALAHGNDEDLWLEFMVSRPWRGGEAAR